MRAMRRSAAVLLRVAAVAAAAIAFDRLCIEPFRGNLLLRDVLQRSSAAQLMDTSSATVLARTNLQELARAEKSRRLDAAWYMLDAANCQMLDRWDEAADVYTRALRIDDRPE